jgi:AAA domain
MVSALLPSVEHFIQIGDHQQLRPQINNYNLSLESHQGKAYQLDRSQFERLSVRQPGRPQFPVAQLNVQRRMRPDISTLIRETIYPRLSDHEVTKTLPDVIGMRKNVFWLDHDHEEGRQADVLQRSHSNAWEVDMTHALVRHIVRQGVYGSSEIAVLTPYTGQLQKLRAKMRSDFEIVLSERDQETLAKEGFDISDSSSEDDHLQASSGPSRRPLEKKKLSELLRVATVDNFQGEEAKIIIVSLVRSNNAQKVGFLKTTNRINVLLSRAQHGMYLIGNRDTYSHVPMWAQVLALLEAKDSVGKSLELCCPRHTDIKILVTEPDDFGRLSPEGGCQLACDRRLSACGHRCQARCHSEGMHLVFACPQPCQRLHSPCNHSCQKETCGEDCGLCMVKLNDIQLPCGHTKDQVACHLTQDLSRVKCTARVQKQVPGCKHTVQVECWRDVASELFRCPTPCETILACGHPCSGSCSRCNKVDKGEFSLACVILDGHSNSRSPEPAFNFFLQARPLLERTTANHMVDVDHQPIVEHPSCTKVCGRLSGTCNHACGRRCHSGNDCGPCLSPCEVRLLPNLHSFHSSKSK